MPQKTEPDMPSLTPAPPPPVKTERPNGMPTLTPKPVSTPPVSEAVPIKEQPKIEIDEKRTIKAEPLYCLGNNGVNKVPLVLNGNHTKTELEDITDDEMSISDSDDYDESQMNEMNKSYHDHSFPPPPLKAAPVPAPPPLRSRPSRFSDIKSAPPPLARGRAPPLARAPSQQSEDRPIVKIEIPPFKKINENDYICSKDLVKAGKDSRKMECECRPSKNETDSDPCGETSDCLNRHKG